MATQFETKTNNESNQQYMSIQSLEWRSVLTDRGHPPKTIDSMPEHQLELMYFFSFLSLDQASKVTPEQATPLMTLLMFPQYLKNIKQEQKVKLLLSMSVAELNVLLLEGKILSENPKIEKQLDLLKNKFRFTAREKLKMILLQITQKGHDIDEVLKENLSTFDQYEALALGAGLTWVKEHLYLSQETRRALEENISTDEMSKCDDRDQIYLLLSPYKLTAAQACKVKKDAQHWGLQKFFNKLQKNIDAVLDANLCSFVQFKALDAGISLPHVQAWQNLDEAHLKQYLDYPWMQHLLPKLIEKKININELLDAKFDIDRTKFLAFVQEANIDWVKAHPEVDYQCLVSAIERKNININLAEITQLRDYQYMLVGRLTIPQALKVKTKEHMRTLDLYLDDFIKKQIDIDALLSANLSSDAQYEALGRGAPLNLIKKLPSLRNPDNAVGLNIAPEELEKCNEDNVFFLLKPYCFTSAQAIKVKPTQRFDITQNFQAFKKHQVNIDALLDANFKYSVQFSVLAAGVPLPCVQKLQDLDETLANTLSAYITFNWIYPLLHKMMEYKIDIQEVLDAKLNKDQVEFLILTEGRATTAWIKAHPNVDISKAMLALKEGADFKEVSEFASYHFEIWLKAKARHQNLNSEDIHKVTKPRQAALIINFMEKYDFAELVNLSLVALLALEAQHPLSEIRHLENWQISLLLGDETRELAPMTLVQVKQLRLSSPSSSSQSEETTESSRLMFSEDARSASSASSASGSGNLRSETQSQDSKVQLTTT